MGEAGLNPDIRCGKVYTPTKAENMKPKQKKERTLGGTDITAIRPEMY